MYNILTIVFMYILCIFGVNCYIRTDPYYYIQPCANNPSTIDNCLLHLINNFIKEVNENGIPNLNLSRAEPIYLDPIQHTMDWALTRYNINFTDVVATGASNLKVKRIRANTNKLRIEADLFIPHLEVNSTFKTFFNFFGMDVQRGGDFFGIFDNLNCYATLVGKAINRDGEVYLEVNDKDFNIDYTIQFAQMRVGHLWSGNQVMEAAFNFFLSSNSQGVINDAKPQMMKAVKSKFLQIFSYILSNVPLRKFVEAYYVRPCENNQATLDNCLVNTGNNFFGQINKLIPKLQLRKPDPYVLDFFTANLTMGPFARYELNFTNVVTTGFSAIKFTRIRLNVEKLRFEGDLQIPHVSVTANYNSIGKVLWASIPREGEFYGEFNSVNCYIYFNSTARSRNGVVFLKLQDLTLDFTVQSSTMRIDKVTFANPFLQGAFNAYLAANGNNVMREMYPILTDVFKARVTEALNNLFEKVPLQQLVKGSKYFR